MYQEKDTVTDKIAFTHVKHVRSSGSYTRGSSPHCVAVLTVKSLRSQRRSGLGGFYGTV